jgi:hypothetical protein
MLSGGWLSELIWTVPGETSDFDFDQRGRPDQLLACLRFDGSLS